MSRRVPSRDMKRPDVLVLGGGGPLGEAWLRSLLAGLEAGSGWDLREADAFVGTSAGSIVAATLAAGRRPRTADASERAADARKGTVPFLAVARAREDEMALAARRRGA